MDETPEYIKMCEMAIVDLHVHWKGKQGDFLYLPHKKKTYVAYMTVYGEFNMPQEVHFFDDEINGDSYSFIGDYIPLFRQDQLIEIVGKEKDRNDMGIFDYFVTWHNQHYHFPEDADWSLEIAWFKFTMYSLHNKVWNGEDWVVA